MITLPVSEADLAEANYERFHHPEPLIQKRMHALYFAGLGYNQIEISELLCVHRNTIGEYERLYNQEGLEGLRTLRHYQPVSELDQHTPCLEKSFREDPPRTVSEAAERISKLTGVQRSPTRVRAYMHRIGMRVLRTGHVPAKADTEKQKQFVEQTLNPLIERCEKGECHLFYTDAVHFVLGAFMTMVWCFERVFFRSSSGRFRFNVLGAVHATTQHLTWLCNDTYINAHTIIELLEKLAREYSDLPLYLVLDNARYQHCRLVKEKAKDLHINLVFLPAYSPNLNLIERLWKYLKKKLCYACYYENKTIFQKAIINQLDQLNTPTAKQDLKKLLTPNFQLFNRAQLVPV